MTPLRPTTLVILGIALVVILVFVPLVPMSPTFALGLGRGLFRLGTFFHFGFGLSFFFVPFRRLALLGLGPFESPMPLPQAFFAVIPGREQLPQALQAVGPGSRLFLLFFRRATGDRGLPRNLGLVRDLGSLRPTILPVERSMTTLLPPHGAIGTRSGPFFGSLSVPFPSTGGSGLTVLWLLLFLLEPEPMPGSVRPFSREPLGMVLSS